MKKFEDLQRLQELKEKGVITEQEFEIEKSKILNNGNAKQNNNNNNNNNELSEKKIKIINVIYGFLMFFSVIFEINLFNQLLHVGETGSHTAFSIQEQTSELKMNIIVGIVIICVITFIWKKLISYFRKNEK